MECKEEYDKQNNYSEQKRVLEKYEASLKPLRKVMRRYKVVLDMTDMPTPPDSSSCSLSQRNRIDLRTGIGQSTPAHPKE